jgi:hypothetical protein
MKILKRTLVVLIVLFIAIQFFRPARNIGEVISANEVTAAVAVPDDVLGILKNSCFDCHSNNTRYPWYVNIQPAGWFMSGHIQQAKRSLNFSEFATYSPRRQYDKLNAIIENVNDGEMPLPSYLLIHAEAKLSAGQKEKIVAWTTASLESMRTKYPADSLLSNE